MKFDALDDWYAAQRKPDNYRVDVSWNSKFNTKLFGRIHKWGEKPYVHEWKNGMLDTLFAGLEDEAERCARKLGLQ